MNRILLGSAVTVLLLAGCGDEKKTTAEATAKIATEQTTTKEVVAEATKDVSQTVTKAATEVTNTVTEATNKVVKNTTEAVKETTASVMETAKEVTNPAVVETAAKIEAVKEATKEVVSETKETAANAVSQATTTVATAVTTAEEKTDTALVSESEAVASVAEGLDGALLFKSCASCHGQKAEKEALGKSQVIAGWDKEKTIQALNGYKDGSYGGVMKNIMKGQVATKTDAEIDALATFISNL